MNHVMNSHRPVSIGIDVSKEKLDVALLAPDHRAEVRTYDNTTSGVTRLLADLKTQRTAKTVPCVIESTGSIHVSKLIASLAKCEKIRQQLVAHRNELAESCAVIGAVLDMEQYDTAIVALEEQIGALRAMVCAHAPEEAIELAANVKGISTEQTTVLLASLKDKHFEHRDQLVAFVGLDVMSRKSGAWVGKQKLSKRGNAYLRKVLYQMAWGLKTHHVDFRAYYERLREKGHHYTTCLIAVARKFLRFLFAFYYKRSVTFPQASV